MSNSSEQNVRNWQLAVAVATGRAEPNDHNLTPAVPTLEQWWHSAEATAARELLSTVDQEIDLGYSETCMSMTSAVVLTDQGFFSHRGVVGMAAAYTTQKPKREQIEPAEAALRAIDYAYEEITSSRDVVTFIRAKLDDIAREVNEQALEKLKRRPLTEPPMFVTSRIQR